MSDFFLTKLLINEFRTFSECEIRLPNSPGVLLVCGPNGLGKSTLFDGLEWCLSGKVDRFEHANRGVTSDQYLRNWHSRLDRQTSVEATFTGGESTRRRIVDQQEIQDGEEPSKLMQSTAWRSPIGDLHNYLLLTHFLGQSTLTRMTHRQATQRWEYLKGPARSDWATEIATSLHGHGNSAEARAFNTAATEAQAEAKRLEDLLRSEEAVFASSRVAGAIDETQLIAQAATVLDDLQQLDAEVTINESPASGQVALNHLSETIGKLRTWLTGRETKLERAAACLRQYNEANARVTELQANLTPATASMTDLQHRVESATSDLKEVEARLQQAKIASAELSSKLAAIETLRNLLDTRALQEKNRIELDSEVERLDQDLAAAEERVRVADKRLRISQSIDARLRTILQEINDEEARQKLGSDISELDERIVAQSAQIESLQKAAPDLVSRLQLARGRQQAASERLQANRTALSSARSAVDQLTAAVVQVAAHIEDSTCVCPICFTDFEPGELRRRASASAEALGPTLAPLEELVQQAQKEVDDAASDARTLAAQESELREAHQQLSALVEERSAKVVRWNASLGVEGKSDPAPTQPNLSALQQRANRLRHWIRIIGEPGTLQSAWSTELLSRNNIGTRLTERRKSRDGEALLVVRAEEDIQFTVGLLGIGNIDGLADELLAIRSQKGQAEKASIDAEINLQRAQAALDGLERELSAAITRQKGLSVALEAARGEVDRTVTVWAGLGMPGDRPTEDERSKAELLTHSHKARISTAEQTMARLRLGFSITLQQDAHKEAFSQLQAAVDASPSLGRDETLQLVRLSQAQAVARAQNYLRAQRIAHTAYQQINQRVGAFNQRYLKPVNDLMNKINRAILTDPDVGLDLEFSRNAVRQRTRPLPKAPRNIENLDPLLVHSEGQMAALAVSMLCAASITFTWSRWRGLVMDDPLQHNDIVHASAFADLMRNLIREKNYQILLSTHDLGQADFLRRKFVAGGIPCVLVQLVGRGKEGTLIQVDDQYSHAA
ncbi:AAA family ATPase [Mesorhizobium sp. WSM4313]|uniref:AAA family ATPase n=1 Tax=Mesorhizobium sp. WSM4313 TaxID=2029412 RepID=UPI001596AC68|nr:AAA family ATPase [Mesorhizobium sp. WSM4313]